MSTGYQIVKQDGLHYVTFQIVNWGLFSMFLGILAFIIQQVPKRVKK